MPADSAVTLTLRLLGLMLVTICLPIAASRRMVVAAAGLFVLLTAAWVFVVMRVSPNTHDAVDRLERQGEQDQRPLEWVTHGKTSLEGKRAAKLIVICK